MPIWLLKLFHLIGLTNLTDEQVNEYVRYVKPVITVCRFTVVTYSEKKTNNPKPSIKADGGKISLTTIAH